MTACVARGSSSELAESSARVRLADSEWSAREADRRNLQTAVRPQRRLETAFVERLTLRVLGLGDAVAVGRDEFIRLDRRLSGLVRRVREHAERDAALGEALDRSVVAEQQRRRVAGVHVRQLAGPRIEDGVEQRD